MRGPLARVTRLSAQPIQGYFRLLDLAQAFKIFRILALDLGRPLAIKE
jgi:hypothetical protein